MTAVGLRRARPDESALLSSLAREAKAHWGYGAEVLAGWNNALAVTPHAIAEGSTVVAEANGEVLGFAQVAFTVGRADLEHLWVRPSHMHQGIGRTLLQNALLEVRTRHHLELHIDADPHAEPFYMAQGARRVGAIAAPIPGKATRVRPQLVLSVRSG